MIVKVLLRILLTQEAILRRLDAIQGASGDWLTVSDAMRIYRVSREHLRRLAREGEIIQSLNRPVRYSRKSLDWYYFKYRDEIVPETIHEARAS